MVERSVTHVTFVVERTYDASPERVFAAHANPGARASWFAGPDEWRSSDHELDFRVGGREHVSGGAPGDPVHTYEAVYADIVPNERILATYEMYVGKTPASVSVATTELRPHGTGTRLVYTEQGAFLDGVDSASFREHGVAELLDQLGDHLQRESAHA